jgi:hypothetical protein
MNMKITFQDHKGEGRRLLNHFSSSILVLRPDQEFWNMLEPIGPSEIYYSAWANEFARAFNLRAETWPELVEILKRIEGGMKPGDPYPSLKDFEKILWHLAEHDNRSKLETAARALAALNAVLGRTAHIRKAPYIETEYDVVIYECQGLPPRIDGFLAAIRLLRMQLQSTVVGNQPQRCYLLDEAGNLFSKELSQAAGSGYISAAKRAITQIRKTGTGILAGVQVISETDDCLKANVASIVCLHCSNPKDAREAANLLLLPETAAVEIQSLPVGMGFLRSEGFTRPVKIQIPNFNLGPCPSDDEVARRMAPEFARLEQQTIRSPMKPNGIQPLSYMDILGETESSSAPATEVPVAESEPPQIFAEHRALLLEIEKHPEASVTEHYRHLHWSAGRGNRVKEQLLKLGLIDTKRQKSSNGRPREILILTEK